MAPNWKLINPNQLRFEKAEVTFWSQQMAPVVTTLADQTTEEVIRQAVQGIINSGVTRFDESVDFKVSLERPIIPGSIREKEYIKRHGKKPY